MAKRSKKGSQTRTRLLETAGQLFRVQGFHATGLDEVLKVSETPKGSLYHYFPGGKDQLACEALKHAAAEMEQRMAAHLDSSHDPVKGLQTLMDFAAKSLRASDFRNGCPIAAVTLDVACDRESVRETCDQCFDTLLTVFARHLANTGISEKRAASLATLCFAALEGGLILSRAQKSIAPLKAIANELVQIMRAATSPSKLSVTRRRSLINK